MSTFDRRAFLRRSAGAAVGAAAAGPFQGFLAASVYADPASPVIGPVADLRDGVVRLALPPGFAYRSFHDNSAGAVLSNGTTMPGRHDGMTAFAGPSLDTVRLVRNHEINGAGSVFAAGAPVYDTAARGGTTTTVVGLRGEVTSSVASLTGTQNNCAGGPTPWGSWVTCEETINGPDVFDDFTRGTRPPNTFITNALLQQPHGFIFEVPTTGAASAQPITSAGRFAHEAVVFDSSDGVLYLTEDDFGLPSGFYKYVPPSNAVRSGRIDDGGELFMLAVDDRPRIDLTARYGAGTKFTTHWVRIDDPNPTFPTSGGLPTVTNDEAIRAVAEQGWAQGAAYFSRLEGVAIDGHRVYFTSTQGGGNPEDPDVSVARTTGYGKGSGQVWSLHTRSGQLELVYESPGPDALDLPDNITVSRRGTLVVCEDGTNLNFIRGITKNGRLFTFAQNIIANRTGDEFAGATFSPGYETLYVNIHGSNALTFAIWGPWKDVGF